jgi:hypothetical protein
MADASQKNAANEARTADSGASGLRSRCGASLAEAHWPATSLCATKDAAGCLVEVADDGRASAADAASTAA